MTQDWRIEQNFTDAWGNAQKRMMRQERRPAVTNAGQILGPGAGPFAVLINDWNMEETTFNGIFYSEPGAVNGPDDLVPLDGDYYWLGETFGVSDENSERWGFQRLVQYRVVPDGSLGSWQVYVRRFYPQGDLVGFSDWEAL